MQRTHDMGGMQAGEIDTNELAMEPWQKMNVECFELDLDTWQFLLTNHPLISNKIMANLAGVLAQRLRRTSDYLRSMRS